MHRARRTPRRFDYSLFCHAADEASSFFTEEAITQATHAAMMCSVETIVYRGKYPPERSSTWLALRDAALPSSNTVTRDALNDIVIDHATIR